jgi:hypothetical protein
MVAIVLTGMTDYATRTARAARKPAAQARARPASTGGSSRRQIRPPRGC